jgi:hypothetical protein
MLSEIDDEQWPDTHFFGLLCHGQEAMQTASYPQRGNQDTIMRQQLSD